MRWRRLIVAIATIAAQSVGCSGGSGSSSARLTLPGSLGLVEALQTVSDDLGTGTYAASISQAIVPPIGVFTSIDAFLAFMGTVDIPTTATTLSSGTASGDLKIDFAALSSVTVDINGDGTGETLACSRSAAPPACAWLWLDARPFAFLVVAESASGSNLGNGIVVFLANEIGAGDAGTSINFQWIGTTSSKSSNVSMAGSAGSTATATIAHVTMEQTSSAGEISNTVKSSGRWTAFPLSCETTESILGFVSTEDYISANLTSDGSGCGVLAGLTCVRISTATEANSMDKCGIDLNGVNFASLPETAVLAELPSNFPPTPTF